MILGPKIYTKKKKNPPNVRPLPTTGDSVGLTSDFRAEIVGSQSWWDQHLQ